MKTTFKFCMQLPDEEFPTVLLLMQSYLKNKHPQASITAKPVRPTFGEFKLQGSKNAVSAFKKWATTFPGEENAFSHYFCENPLRKEYEQIPLNITKVATDESQKVETA